MGNVRNAHELGPDWATTVHGIKACLYKLHSRNQMACCNARDSKVTVLIGEATSATTVGGGRAGSTWQIVMWHDSLVGHRGLGPTTSRSGFHSVSTYQGVTL